MKMVKLTLALATLMYLAMQCNKNEEQPQIPAEIELYGTITDKQTNLPLKGIIVQLSNQVGMGVIDVSKAYTDTLGKYDLKFQPNNTASYFLDFDKGYYAGDFRNVSSYKDKQEFNLQLERDSTYWVNKK